MNIWYRCSQKYYIELIIPTTESRTSSGAEIWGVGFVTNRSELPIIRGGAA